VPVQRSREPARPDQARPQPARPSSGTGRAQLAAAPEALLALQAAAGNRSVAAAVQRATAKGWQRPIRLAVAQRRISSSPVGGPGPAPGEEVAAELEGGPAEAPEPAAAAKEAAPPGAADAGPSGGEGSGAPGGSGALGGGGAGSPEAALGADPDRTRAALDRDRMEPGTAELVAQFNATFGRTGAVTGPAAALLRPSVRAAAAAKLPARAGELGVPQPEQAAQHTAEAVQRQGVPTVQRQGLPTRKVKVSIAQWKPIDLFKDRNVGSWFLLSGAMESPAFEGEAKPPASLDNGTEQELQLAAEGGVTGYAATFHKNTLAKSGQTELEGKVAVEANTEGVKVSGLSLKLPNWGPQGTLLQGQLDFDLLNWPAGKLPELMVLSYTQKIGYEEKFTNNGWTYTGQLYVPLKLSIKPNPAKVAEYVARVIGPRLAAAAPAGLAIAAPLVAGGVCLAIWANAIEAGEAIATAGDYAVENTKNFTIAYVGTVYGHSNLPGGAGGAAGAAAGKRVLDAQRWDDLPEGARAKIREEYLKTADLGVPAAQGAMWKVFRDKAVAQYRADHSWDAWAYDNGLPNNMGYLLKVLEIRSPPWPISSY